MEFLKKLDAAAAAFMRGFVTALCIGIAFILFFRVIIRFSPLIMSISWTDEIIAWMMAWMIFIAAVLIMRDHAHFRVDLLDEKLAGTKLENVLNIFISLLGIAFFATFFYYSLSLVLRVGALKQFALSPILKVSDMVPYSSMPVSCALIIIYLIRDLVVEAGKLTKK